MERLLDIWDTFRYWVVDNKQLASGLVVMVMFLSFIVYILIPKPAGSEVVEGVAPYSLAEVEAMKEFSTELDDTFSLLEETTEGSNPDYPAFNVFLYLKKPFISENDLMAEVNKLIDIYKWREDYHLSGMKINIYDRKEVYDLGYEPRTTMYYMKKLSEETTLTEEEGGSYIPGTDVFEMNFQETIEVGEQPEYEDYVLNPGAFRAMKTDESITPLTDQEFSFYLKMYLYSALKDGSDYSGAQLYLQWDLGRSLTEGGVNTILREFRAFKDRHLDLNGQKEYIDNIEYIKRDLAIESPQFLLFAETGKIVSDPLEAQKELLKYNSSVYQRPLEEYVEERSTEISEELENVDDEEIQFDIED